MKEERLVSVLMPCYREDISFFCDAVNSVLNQTYTNWELLLILDDPNNLELKKKANEFAALDKRVKILENKKNMGIVDSLNNAIDYANGLFIARLDADDIAMPNRIEEQMKYIDDYDMISTNFSFINMEGNVIRERKFPSEERKLKHYLREIADCMYHTTWLLKKDMYIQLGKYRNVGPFEDYDFILRGIKEGYRVYNIPDILCYYRYNVTGISSKNKVYQHLGSEYLRDNYERIDEIDSNEILNYLETDLAKYKKAEYEKFVYWKKKIFDSNNTLNFTIKIIAYGLFITLFNYYGRKKVIDWFKEVYMIFL